MKKLDLTNVQEFTEFRRPVGGFVIKIMAVEDIDDKEYLKIYWDIVQAVDPKDAEFVGMYTKRKKERGFEYPSTVVSYKDSALSMFKGFCTAIQESNNGYDFTQTYNEAELVGKVCGFILGEEEYMGKDKNGAPKVRVRTYVYMRKSVDSILKGDFTIPPLKKLDQSATSTPPNPFKTAVAQSTPTQSTPTPNPFADIPQQTAMPAEQPDDFSDIPF